MGRVVKRPRNARVVLELGEAYVNVIAASVIGATAHVSGDPHRVRNNALVVAVCQGPSL